MNGMNNDIQLNQKQELKLNPEMLQSIRILQMNYRISSRGEASFIGKNKKRKEIIVNN